MTVVPPGIKKSLANKCKIIAVMLTLHTEQRQGKVLNSLLLPCWSGLESCLPDHSLTPGPESWQTQESCPPTPATASEKLLSAEGR